MAKSIFFGVLTIFWLASLASLILRNALSIAKERAGRTGIDSELSPGDFDGGGCSLLGDDTARRSPRHMASLEMMTSGGRVPSSCLLGFRNIEEGCKTQRGEERSYAADILKVNMSSVFTGIQGIYINFSYRKSLD